jgi:hypothetical protein
MGIPTDYNNESFMTRCNFRPPNWIPEPVLMLPISKDRVAMHKCIGDNAKGSKLATARPNVNVRFAVDVEVYMPPVCHNQQAPLKMVCRHVWSPGIYQALRLLGKSLVLLSFWGERKNLFQNAFLP